MKVHVLKNSWGPERDVEIIDEWDKHQYINRYVAVDIKTGELCIIYQAGKYWYYSYHNEFNFPIR